MFKISVKNQPDEFITPDKAVIHGNGNTVTVLLKFNSNTFSKHDQ